MDFVALSHYWLWGKITESECARLLDEFGYTNQEIVCIISGWKKALSY